MPNSDSPAQEDILAALADAIVDVGDRDQALALLRDLCTPAEVRALAERWQVARLLDEDRLTYREIHQATGVSTTTIVRVGRFLRQEPHQGYRTAINRLRGGDAV